MEYKLFRNIYKIESLWSDKSYWSEQTFYQSFTWNCFLYNQVRHVLSARIGLRCMEYHVALRDGRPVMIAPFEVSRTSRKVRIASGQVAGVLDFVYARHEDVSDQDIEGILNHLRSHYKGYKLVLYDIPMVSPLGSYLEKRRDNFRNYIERGSYHIPIGEYASFDDYFSCLGKQTRQNVRTAVNRLNKDGISYRIEHFEGQNAVPFELLYQLWLLYVNRSMHWKHKQQNISTRYLNHVRCILGLFSKNVIKSLHQLSEAHTVVLFIDEKPASFLIAYHSDNMMLVPKLAHNSVFSRYSPGILICIEVVSWCKANGIEDFDLCRGDEPYKQVVGGINAPLVKLSFKC